VKWSSSSSFQFSTTFLKEIYLIFFTTTSGQTCGLLSTPRQNGILLFFETESGFFLLAHALNTITLVDVMPVIYSPIVCTQFEQASLTGLCFNSER